MKKVLFLMAMLCIGMNMCAQITKKKQTASEYERDNYYKHTNYEYFQTEDVSKAGSNNCGIEYRGKQIVPNKYSSAWSCGVIDDIVYFRARIYRNNTECWALYDETGKCIISEDEGFEHISVNGPAICVNKNGKYGLMDINHRMIVEPMFDDDFWRVVIGDDNDETIGNTAIYSVRQNGACGVIDARGEYIIPLSKKYSMVVKYVEGCFHAVYDDEFRVNGKSTNLIPYNLKDYNLFIAAASSTSSLNTSSSSSSKSKSESKNYNPCGACNGSGRMYGYDGLQMTWMNCSWCDGTGRSRISVTIDYSTYHPEFDSSNGGYVEIDNSNNNSSYGGSNGNNRQSTTKADCPYCNGKGRRVVNQGATMMGTNDSKVYCSECGSYFLRSSGHGHIQCGHCGGTGKMR